MDLEAAIRFATAAHAGQKDKQGKPYILHPIRVMLRVSDAAKVVALLHDVLEDTPVTHDFLRDLTKQEAEAVVLLTHTKNDGLTYFEYIERVAKSGNPLAIEVKLADLADNSDPARMTPETKGMAEKRYVKAAKILRGEL